MYLLPDELILVIFESIPLITDKRHFLRVNTHYNKITAQSFINYEKNYKIKDFNKICVYSVEKFTLELCHDRYFNNMPSHYIFPNNKILIICLSYFGSIPLLVLSKDKCCNLYVVCVYASLGGQLAVLQWARTNVDNWNSNTCAYASRNGHLEVLKWLRFNGSDWYSDTCSYAAENGHLEVLKWARNNGCDWDSSTCSYAARNGHLIVLQWARENGCPWNSNTRLNAWMNGNLIVYQWAIENGCP